MPIQEDQGTQCLRLRRGTDVSFHSQVREKGIHFIRSHRRRMFLAVMKNGSANPADVRLLRSPAVMPRAYRRRARSACQSTGGGNRGWCGGGPDTCCSLLVVRCCVVFRLDVAVSRKTTNNQQRTTNNLLTLLRNRMPLRSRSALDPSGSLSSTCCLPNELTLSVRYFPLLARSVKGSVSDAGPKSAPAC